MTKEEYKKFLKLPVIDRIVKMNSGTIKQNLDFLIELSNAEKGIFNEKV